MCYDILLHNIIIIIIIIIIIVVSMHIEKLRVHTETIAVVSIYGNRKKTKPNNNHYGLGDIAISTMGYINF